MLTTIVIAVVGGLSTFALSLVPFIGAIRASTLATLVAYTVFWVVFDSSTANAFGALFFGGSFVGMSSSAKLSWLGVTLAASVFGVLSAAILPLLNGMGGALGVCAFLSVVIVYLSGRLYRKYNPRTPNSN
ncbi:hypothetical protein LHL20_06575 [Alteromonas sp. McT4-15]|uniref:hypothetical protein n=1 Tax=Alteromonas sp. McT4-15 TaxID=2881256 RepID=UPI001CF83F9F|nr:hypothetical protein [Alteromonas sp. McT4-15]MCB4435909.1 hypothetical protein [Alteromonas sp. McT4-15]